MRRPHRTLLITTCARPELMEKQRLSDADVAFLELEDGVPDGEKDTARARAVQALKDWDYGRKERWVRINAVDSVEGMRDLMALAEGRPDAIIPGKLRRPGEIVAADWILSRREEELGLPVGGIRLCPMIETGPAMLDLRAVITASPRVAGVLLGSEDLSVDVGYVRTPEGREIDWVRGHMVLTAHALGVECFDVASVLLRDEETLYAETRRAYHMGFDGKACISPGQVAAIHRGFAPADADVAAARRLIAADREAKAEGRAVFSLDGRMVDAPFVLMAEKVLRRAGLDG